VTDDNLTAPAHRPSRRTDIVDAAIQLFARKGFVDTSISDVAAAADVVVTAVYYHFCGKEELFSAAVNRVFESINDVVAKVRADDMPGDEATLDAVIDAVWGWIDTHPDDAALIYYQLPGTTRQITTLRQEFDDLHVRRAFGYLVSKNGTTHRLSAGRQASEIIAARTLVDMLIAVHTMRLADGPLSGETSHSVRKAVHVLSQRIVATA
jgi:AcrR family transcriptional regulator